MTQQHSRDRWRVGLTSALAGVFGALVVLTTIWVAGNASRWTGDAQHELRQAYLQIKAFDIATDLHGPVTPRGQFIDAVYRALWTHRIAADTLAGVSAFVLVGLLIAAGIAPQGPPTSVWVFGPLASVGAGGAGILVLERVNHLLMGARHWPLEETGAAE